MCDAHEPASRLPHTHPLSRVHTAADVSRPFLPQGVTSVLATILALAASAVAVAVGIDVAIAASAVAVAAQHRLSAHILCAHTRRASAHAGDPLQTSPTARPLVDKLGGA